MDYFSKNNTFIKTETSLRWNKCFFGFFSQQEELSKKPFKMSIPFHKDIIVNVTDLPGYNFLPCLCLETLKLKYVIG